MTEIITYLIFIGIILAISDKDFRASWERAWPIILAPFALVVLAVGIIFWLPWTIVLGVFQWIVKPEHVDRENIIGMGPQPK